MKTSCLLYQLIVLMGVVMPVSTGCIEGVDLDREFADSRFFRNVVWGEMPPNSSSMDFPFSSKEHAFSFSESSPTEQVYHEFAELEAQFPSFIHSHVGGYASNDQELRYYTVGLNNQSAPTIIIICAQHGFEKNSTYGTYLFVQRLVSGDNEFLEYFRDNLNLLIVPVANPSGFNKRSYKNSNKVNLNRNWDVIGWERLTDDIKDKDYGGQKPLDQPETQAIARIILQQEGAVLLLDFHTYGGGVVDNIRQINTLIIPEVDNDLYYNSIVDVAMIHQKRVSSLFHSKYSRGRSLLASNPTIGAISRCSFYRKKGCLNNYGCQNSIISLTFEGFNGFPGDTQPFTKEVAEANADLLQVFLYSFCEFYGSFKY